MKKFLVVLIALLFATGAFAQEAEKKAPEFKYGFYGLSYMDSTSFKAGESKLDYDYTHVRFRPSFSLGNENVKGVVVFEIDQDFGANSKTTDSADKVVSRGSADAGTDNLAVEVKHAYFQVKDILIPNLSVKTGLFGYMFPLLIDNDFGMSQVSYDFGMGNVNFSYIKTQEGFVYSKADDTKIKDDVQTYALDAVVKAGPVNIKPAYIYTQFGKDNLTTRTAATAYAADATYYEDKFSFADGSMWNAGLSIDGEMNGLAFGVTYVMTKGKANLTRQESGASATWTNDGTLVAEDVKISTYAFDAAVSYKVDPVKVGVFYSLYSGTKETEEKYKSHVALMDNVFGAPDGRLFLLDAGGTSTLGGVNEFDSGSVPAGLKIYGLEVEANIAKLTLFAQYAYVQTAQKYENATGSKKNSVGQEIDLKAAYEVAPATSLFIEYGYAKLTKDYLETDKEGTVNSVVVGMSTKI